MRLTSYSVENFRCFGPKVELANLGRVNVIAGPNNVGKSALLLPLRRLSLDVGGYSATKDPRFAGRGASCFLPADRPGDASPVVGLGLRADDEEQGLPGVLGVGNRDRLVFLSEQFFRQKWHEVIRWDAPDKDGTVSGDASSAVGRLARNVFFVPAVRAIRQSVPHASSPPPTAYEYSGETVFADLLHWAMHEQERLQRVERFATDVLGAPVRVKPRTRPVAELAVAVGGDDPRPLDALGHGVEQVLVISAALASVDRPLLLLEEPELGLHPLMQRRLIEALAGLETATTIITTHSPHILDSTDEHVRHYHLRIGVNGAREVRSLSSRDLTLLADLGIRPSSVLQANAVVWVEGPSDVIYLRAWLKAFGGDDVVEGVDFSFAMFGGALLEHLTVDDSDEKRIQLPDIHPSWFLVADSDRDAEDGELGKEYLARLVESIHPSQKWVTAGREVESYVSDAQLAAALGGTVPAAGADKALVALPHAPLGERLKALGLAESWRKKKVPLAERVVKAAGGEWDETLDLQQQVEKLVAFIRAAQTAVVAMPTRESPPPTGPR